MSELEHEGFSQERHRLPMDRENEERMVGKAAVAAPKERCRPVPLVISLLCLASGWLLFGHYCRREYLSVGYLELARRAESEIGRAHV